MEGRDRRGMNEWVGKAALRPAEVTVSVPVHRHHFVRATVQVRQYPGGGLSLFHGPRRLADYQADGTLITQENASKSAA